MLSWEPSLIGSDAERARAAFVPTYEYLSRRVADGLQEFSLCGGAAGVAVSLHECEQITSEITGWQRPLRESVAALRTLRLAPGLWTGFSGITWARTHLLGPGRTSKIDSRLISWLTAGGPGAEEFDLVSGIAGIGVYALTLGQHEPGGELVELIVGRLAARAEPQKVGVAWATPQFRADRTTTGRLNLGLAHGQAGVVAVLASIAATPQPPSGTLELLGEAASFLTAQLIPRPSPYAFSQWIGPPRPPACPRLAWCYGDAGIAIALTKAASILGDSDTSRIASEVARRAAERSIESALVVDAGLCHGAAGLGHLFARLRQLTGEPSCAEAAHRWLMHAIALHLPEPAAGPFPMSWPANDGGRIWRADLSLLTGAAGAALALLSACSREEPTWDAVFLGGPIGPRE